MNQRTSKLSLLPWPKFWSYLWPYLWLLVPAAFLRFYQIELKPIHFDEGINGFFVQQMWVNGFYDYNPENFHGSLLFYLFQLAEVAIGPGIGPMRAVTVLAGLGCVLTICLLETKPLNTISLEPISRRMKDSVIVAKWPAVLVALVVALSPGFVFFSRSAIHESLFVLGEILFLSAWLNYYTCPNRRAIWTICAAIVIMLATKETTIIFLGVFGLARVALWVSKKIRRGKWPHLEKSELSSDEIKKSWIWASAAAVFLLVMLFTGFTRDMASFKDFFSTYMFWTKTGLGKSGHEKPFYYWLELMSIYEWPFLLALAVSPFFLLSRNLKLRFLAITSVGFFLAYSIIPYKTPWLILNILFALAVMSVEVLGQVKRFRPVVSIGVVLALTAIGTVKTWKLNFVNFTNEQERYLYVQSTQDLKTIQEELARKVMARPEMLNMNLKILIRDPWPLPYIFGRWPKASFSSIEAFAAETAPAPADLVLIEGVDREKTEAQFREGYWRWQFTLRHAKEKCYAYLRTATFADLQFPGAELVGFQK